MEVSTPFGGDVLRFSSMRAHEELGRLFEYQIEALSERNDLNPDEILGKNVTVRLELPFAEPRCFDGYVTRFGLSGISGRYYRYRLTARPWLWLLTRNSDCRIFQNKTVPEILKEIFDKYPSASFDTCLTGSYTPKDYCVQYRETDFNFVSRLMEQEGIYYYFEHADGLHTLVLADGPSAHRPFSDDYRTIPFIPHDRGGRLDQEYIDEWYFSREIQPGAYVIDDFDFTKPSADLRASTRREREHAQSSGEYYDYPGEYRQASDGDHYVKVRLEELQSRYELVEGAGNARGIAVGSLFRLSGQPRDDQNREYLVVRTTLELEDNGHESQDGVGARLRCGFAVLDSRETFRPQRVTPKPAVQGPQTAIVVGPKGDEIYTDDYGRVKVQFHWDRRGESNQNSSCWVRVSHPWAGKNFGMIAIPRIGQEVIVDFLEGDPDNPMVTGRVYNKEHMPPWTLADHKTRTGIVTRSTQGGSTSTANELRFEDKKGDEEIFIHAERQLRTEVEVDELRDVGRDRTTDIHGIDRLTVDKSRYEHVKGDFRDLLVDKMSVRRIGAGEVEEITDGLKTTITSGGHEHTVSAGGQTLKITDGIDETVTGAVSQTIQGGGYTQSVTGGNATHTTLGGAWNVEASNGLNMKTPAVMNIEALGGINITAPAGVNLLAGTKLMGYATEEGNIKSYDWGIKGINVETKGVDIGAITFKGENVAFQKSEVVLNKIATVLQLANPVTLISQGAIAVHKKAMTIIG
ncbi:type VI secretion system tip protein VgrG [Aquabacterium sp. A7-Y]|uniref:type VI secretion system Vgr family protein n=1 Tax=Aquabacterium sp. A7-Y TaxID=1349605 RepID=UPI00223E29E4|nr:type VI secretion system tip protein VgrG [Aquabacterium sp. A7-Y]MCW7540755.1 type VI secretion system tip protein VgrG [Aquabacterium sp. A7-Y]